MKKHTKLTSVLLAAAMLITASCSGGNSQTTTTTTASAAVPDTAANGDTAAPADDTTEADAESKADEPADEPDDTQDDGASGNQTVTPDASNVKLIGRTLEENGVLWLAQSASGVEFTFKGTELSVDIKGDGAASGDADSQARFAVYINGERKLDEMVDSSEKTYDIFSADSEEEVTVKIIKLSESANSTFGIENISFVGSEISPTPAKDLKIEFIGDSITCGYGVDDEDRDHHFSTKTEDATKTYAYKTAEAFDADYSFVSYSGHGIISGYTADGKKNEQSLVPPVYEQFTKTYGSSNGYYDETTPWDFSSFVPDYIVINLGTNDSSYVKTKEARQEFIDGCEDFIKQVRNNNPDAYIFWALGTMGMNLNSSVKKAVEAYIEETGDDKVTFIALSQQNGDKNGYAADWHPTEATHTEAAEKLVLKMKEFLEGGAADEDEAA